MAAVLGFAVLGAASPAAAEDYTGGACGHQDPEHGLTVHIGAHGFAPDASLYAFAFTANGEESEFVPGTTDSTGAVLIDVPVPGATTDAGSFAIRETTDGLDLVGGRFADCEAPGQPTIDAPVAGNASATVSWGAPVDDGGMPITEYEIQTYHEGAVVKTTSAAAAETSSLVTGLTNGLAYTFTVAARNAVGPGSVSTPTAAVTPAPTAPETPAIGEPTRGNASVYVRWGAPATGGSPIAGYVIRTYSGTTLVKTTGAAGTARASLITGLTNGVAYTFTVAAVNAIGTGAYSAASAAVTPATVPGGPAIGAPTRGNASATVRWAAPGNGGSPIAGYVIRTYLATTLVKTTTEAGTATSSLVTGLTNGGTYRFTVAARNGVGTGAYSAVSAAVTPATLPGTPAIGAPTRGNASVYVRWAAPGNGGSPIAGYVIRTYSGTTLVKTTGAAGTATASLITGLTNGVSYRFTVAARNAVGTGAASAASAAVIPATVPGAPRMGTATRGVLAATVRWAPPTSNGGSPITGYAIRAYRGTTLVKAITAGPTATSAVVPGLASGAAYTFTVTARNAVGWGAPSALSAAVAPAPANPGDTKNCTSFATWSDAQRWFQAYYPYYGDVARLDGDNDRIACETLPGHP